MNPVTLHWTFPQNIVVGSSRGAFLSIFPWLSGCVSAANSIQSSPGRQAGTHRRNGVDSSEVLAKWKHRRLISYTTKGLSQINMCIQANKEVTWQDRVCYFHVPLLWFFFSHSLSFFSASCNFEPVVNALRALLGPSFCQSRHSSQQTGAEKGV